MTKEQSDVIDFMDMFDVEVGKKPFIPNYQVRKLRAKLIMEESLETVKALGFNVDVDILDGRIAFEDNLNLDLVGIADGLADSHYVSYCGTGAAFGIDMEPIFAEVHRSNMSKLWAEDELGMIPPKIGTSWKIKSGIQSKRKIIVRNGAGKIIKSPSYSPAEIKRELNFQGAGLS